MANSPSVEDEVMLGHRSAKLHKLVENLVTIGASSRAHDPNRDLHGSPPHPYSTMSLPRSMPIWQVNSYSPGFSGRNSTGTVSPVGRWALLPKSLKTTISEQAAVSSRRKFRRTGLPCWTRSTSGV